MATGRKVNLEGLRLEEIGVAFDRKGIEARREAEDQSRTTFTGPGVDVTGVYQFTHAAGYEGGIVVSNAVFRFPRKVSYTHLPWVTYTDPELASIGMNEKSAKARGDQLHGVVRGLLRATTGAVQRLRRSGKIKMLLDEKERLLGVQILGPRAGDLLSEWVAVMNGNNVRLSTVASAVHPYLDPGRNQQEGGGKFPLDEDILGARQERPQALLQPEGKGVRSAEVMKCGRAEVKRTREYSGHSRTRALLH